MPGGGHASPFALTPHRDDTALFQDARIGFSHLVPGRPSLGPAAARPGDPPADAILHLQDAPIAVRYRVEAPFFAAPTAADLARETAARYASWRAQANVVADRANETWLAAWGVEAAAVAAYDLPPSTAAGTGHGREDLFVLVRHGVVLLVSWTYPRGFVDDPAYASFASVAEATMIWDPMRWEQRGRVWPVGEFLEPGLYGAPKPKYNEAAKELVGTPLLPEERSRLFTILSGVVSGAGAPWVPLAPELRESNRRAILGAVQNGRVRTFVEEAFADVRTAHDLRGLAIILGRALDDRRSSSSQLAPLPGAAAVLKPPSAPRIKY